MAGLFRRMLGALGLGKSKDLTKRYLEFYYPATNRSFYEIGYDWGTCLVTLCGAPDEDAHEDSRPYLGYVVHRPVPDDPADIGTHPTFLVTPEAEVWRIEEDGDIPASRTREEVTVAKTDHGTSTTTVTITSAAEPVIDHFLAHPEAFTRHGVLKESRGTYRLR